MSETGKLVACFSRAAAPGATVGEGLAVTGGFVSSSRDLIQAWVSE